MHAQCDVSLNRQVFALHAVQQAPCNCVHIIALTSSKWSIGHVLSGVEGKQLQMYRSSSMRK